MVPTGSPHMLADRVTKFLVTLSASVKRSVGNPTVLNLSKPEFLVCDVVDIAGAVRVFSVLTLVSILDLPMPKSCKPLTTEFVGTSGPVETLTVLDLPAFEFLVSEPVTTSDPVACLIVLDLPTPEPPTVELLGTSGPVGRLTRLSVLAPKVLVRESARDSSSEEAGTVTDVTAFGSLIIEPVALILDVLLPPVSIMPCSRYGRGCAGKKVVRQRGQLLLSRSQVTMHAEPNV